MALRDGPGPCHKELKIRAKLAETALKGGILAMEWYKVSEVILASALIAMLSGKVADTLVDPTMPTEAALAVADAPAAPAAAKPQAVEVDISGALVMLASADVDKGAKIAKKCASCHSFNKGGKNKVGPNLWNIVNKSKASVDGYKYSKALAGHGEPWDWDALNGFLANPKAYVKGTKMAYAGLKKDGDRAAMLAYLRSLSESPAALPN